MKLHGPTLLLSVAALAAPPLSFAACSGTALTQAQLTALLAGNTVCGRPVSPGYPGDPSDRWQEQHRTGGQLWDYKMGPGHAVDPTARVGDWSVDTGGTVTHRYPSGGATAYTWKMFGPFAGSPGPVYSFCTVATSPVEQAVAVVVAGEASCAGHVPSAAVMGAPVSAPKARSRPIPLTPGVVGPRVK